MAHYYDFSSDKINNFMILIDSSGSMRYERNNVVEGFKMFRKSFENFPEGNSISVSISQFAEEFWPEEFKAVCDADISRYNPDGYTALYYSIVKSANYLKSYITEVTKRTGCIPRATFIVFSDGMPEQDRMSRDDALKAIKDLNYAGITTVFVAFGDAITSEFGKRMGFMSTLDVKDRSTLVKFLGVDLSKSCKEQSKSMKSLGANFFSQAVDNSKSSGYSTTTNQALEDDDWFNDI